MYIKQICSRNVGPTKQVNLEFCRNSDKNPKPVILVGENGTGKSTILSNIVDAFYEIAGISYNDVRESADTGYQYYKAISPTEINLGNDYMFSYIEFDDLNEEHTSIYQYVFKSGKLSKEDFQQETGATIKDSWGEDENIKRISASRDDIKKIFEKKVFCFFGPDRYEKPQWMGEKYYRTKQKGYAHIGVNQRYDGNLDAPITVKNVSKETLQWLLDIIVDSRMDIISKNGQLSLAHADFNNVLALGIARQNIERVMSEILGKEVYFGLNFRSAHGSRFNIFDKKDEQIIIPTLDSLSTGQSALFNMFATIIRYADSKNINESIKIQEIRGIVVIDEIELHLHSRLQREVLPKLLKLFPKIQFIITTHSPLFLLGMDEQYGKDGYCIYQMPDAEEISSECFTEFQNAYTYMAQTEKHQSEIRKAIKSKTQKTLIVTEGATDWRHLKSALCSFQSQEENRYKNLDIEFLEYNPKNSGRHNLPQLEMSCSHLTAMCKEFAKLQQTRKIIFIADADDNKTIKELSNGEDKYKNWGNNVYSMILPVPEHRKLTPHICIEHYYRDNDLKTTLEINGINRRIFMGQEFDEFGLSKDKKFMCLDRSNCGDSKINIIDGQSGKRVFKIDDEDQTNLALPKMDFAEAIHTKNPVMKDIDFSEFHLIFDIIKEIDELDT